MNWDQHIESINKKHAEYVKRINSEIDKSKMAYKIQDVDGNQFVFGGIENGAPWFRCSGGSTHIFDLNGFSVIQKYCSL